MSFGQIFKLAIKRDRIAVITVLLLSFSLSYVLQGTWEDLFIMCSLLLMVYVVLEIDDNPKLGTKNPETPFYISLIIVLYTLSLQIMKHLL